MSTTISESLTELFHLVKSLIPENQEIVKVNPNTTVANAIAIMNAKRYSLLPVVEGKAVLGVFSYRSFASRLLDMGRLKEFPGDLPVDEFVEPLAFVQPFDNWERILNHIDADDAVFVGGHNDLKGLVTTADVLNYLRQVASPFVLLAEIETSLRRVIGASVTDEELRACAFNSLKSKYASEAAIPIKLTEMDFNDYAQIIGHGENWMHFSPLFGIGEWARKATINRLNGVRALRNDIFHFKRKLEQEDLNQLTEFRDWLQRKARAFEARRPITPREVTIVDSTDSAASKKWNEQRFFDELKTIVGNSELDAARAILRWSQEMMTDIKWGEGKRNGSFIPRLIQNRQIHQVIGVWTTGYVEFQFEYMLYKPIFNDEAKRIELIQRFNTVPGIFVDPSMVNLRPSIPLSALTDKLALQSFLSVLQWFVDQIKQSPKGRASREVLRYQFWKSLLEKSRDRTSLFANIVPSRDNQLAATAGIRGLDYHYVIRMEDARIELYIDRKNAAENKRIFDELYSYRDEIEANFGSPLEWLSLEGKQACKVQYEISNIGGLRDQSRWPALQDNLIETMIQFDKALQPAINDLSL